MPVQRLTLVEQATSRWIAGGVRRNPVTLAIAAGGIVIADLLGATVDRRAYVVMGAWIASALVVNPWCARPRDFATRLGRYAITAAIDVVWLGAVYYYLRATQYLGIACFLLIALAAGSVLPKRWTQAIAVLIVGVYTALLALDVSGNHPIHSPLGLAPVTGNDSYLIAGVAAAAAIVYLVLRMQGQVLRTMRDSESRHDAIVRTAADMILIFDADGLLVEVNPAATAITGYSWDELKSMPNSALFVSEDWPAALSVFQRTLAGESIQMEYRIVTKSGEPRWMETATSRIEIDGRPAVVVVARDTTVRRRQSDELRENDAKLRLVLDTLNSGFYTIDRQQVVTSVRGRGSGTGSALVGRSVTAIAPSPDEAVVQREQHRRALEGEVVTWVWPVGSGRWVRSHVAPMRDAAGAIVGAAGFWRDETAIVRVREAEDSRWNRFRDVAAPPADDAPAGGAVS